MENILKIAVDAMGGDGSPKKVIEGIIHHNKKSKNIFYNIFGDEKKISEHLLKSLNSNNYEIFNTSEIVEDANIYFW